MRPEGVPFDVPNDAGVFTTFETVRIPGLPVKCTGEFYLAQAAENLWFAGWYLLMRQPANSNRQAPAACGFAYPSREAALTWLIDEAATKFFHDHKGARERLAAWRAKLFTTLELSVDATEMLAAINGAAGQVAALTVPAPDVVIATATLAARYDSVAVGDIEENPYNPRTDREGAAIGELADSIKAQGFLLQPIAVRDLGEGTAPRYRLIAGWRRWQAHLQLGWERIEAKVFVGVDDARAGELALIENLQRYQLNAMEEALGFVELRDRYGYDVQKIHERTGKAESTIKNAFRVAALPAEVCSLVRAGTLALSAAKVLAGPRWAQRPEHCVALARWIVAARVAKDEVEMGLGAEFSPVAAGALAAEKLAEDITGYRDQIDPALWAEASQRERGSDLVQARDGTLWHLNRPVWREEKKVLDEERREKARVAEERAAERAKTAIVEKVNVRVEDLATGRLDYVSLMGANARYQGYLPGACLAEGLEDGKQVIVCLKPSALKALQVREAELLKADGAAKLPGLLARAVEAIKRLKRIGGRELALVVDAVESGWTSFDGRAFEALGVPPPETEMTRLEMARMDPLDLARVIMVSAVLNTEGGALYGALRWVLGVDDLGLVEEKVERREALLGTAATEVFGARSCETDTQRLAEWVKAAGWGMSAAEIARSYKVTEAEVLAALEVKA